MAKKSRMISMRVTEEQFTMLEKLALRIRRKTGFRITRASIILKLMEWGLPQFEQEFPPDQTSRDEQKKRAS